MTTVRMESLLVPAVLALAAVGGCVDPGKIDPTLLNRYQERLVRIGPQQRGAKGRLDLLVPQRDEKVPQFRLEEVIDATTGRKVRRIHLTLSEAVLLALASNTDIRVVSFDPAISKEDMVRAAAAFDYEFFGTISYSKDDLQRSNPLQAGVTKRRVFQAGLRQQTILGTQWEASYTFTRTFDNAAFETISTRYEPVLALEITQPLLRDGWPEFNLAELRIARITRKVSEEQFRQRVEEVVTQVIAAYWQLHLAHYELDIQEKLLAETIRTEKRVRARLDIDATMVEVKQAEAAVATRRARVIRARNNVVDARERLIRFISEEQLNLAGEYQIVLETPPIVTEVRYNVEDQLVTALAHNPALAQARFAIDAADISVRVAKNQLLPRLDLTVTGSFQGLSNQQKQSHANLGTLDYASYSAALTTEIPIGNRLRRADLRQVRLRRLRAIAEMQNIADQVALQVRNRVREIHTAYQEYLAQKAGVQAAKIQLEALESLEEIRAPLTPEFLNTKLGAQEMLANAAIDQVRAVAAYNTAMAELAQATGTVLQIEGVRVILPVAACEADWPVEGARSGPKPLPTQPTGQTQPARPTTDTTRGEKPLP